MPKKFYYITILLLIATCHGNLKNLSAIENRLKNDNFYSSYLALEYLDYARILSMKSNKKNSEYFAKKGLEASQGNKIALENPIKWKADYNEIQDSIMALDRYNKISNYDMQKNIPEAMAHLTFLYDCWVSGESNPNFKLKNLQQCKVRFYKLLDEVEQYVDDVRHRRQPKTVIFEDDFERFEIMFDFNQYNVNEKANIKIIDILKYLSTLNGNYRILLAGNADRAGNELYNQSLARKRVENVKNYLIKNGVAADMISIRAFGEDFPDIITKKGVQHQLNRTVGIYVLKGMGDFSAYPIPLIENYVYKKEIQKARAKRGLR